MRKHYIRKLYFIRDRVEIEINYPWSAGAPDRKRRKRGRHTSESMARINEERRKKTLQRLIECNFEQGRDFHYVLTCTRENRPTARECPAIIRRFLRRARKKYKAQGWAFKYVVVAEIGKRGAVHWHCVFNNCHNEATCTADIIGSTWTLGHAYQSLLYNREDFARGLVEYFSKQNGGQAGNRQTIEKLSYIRSRNLKGPEELRERIGAPGWPDDPGKAIEIERNGEHLRYIVDSNSVYNGVNPYTGAPYQHYTAHKEKPHGQQTTRQKNRAPRSLACIKGAAFFEVLGQFVKETCNRIGRTARRTRDKVRGIMQGR